MVNLEPLSAVATAALNGLPLQTGDLLCNSDGSAEFLVGQFWRVVGHMVPGEVDHIVVYIGPGGRCVESGPLGVNAFEFSGSTWQADSMKDQRGPFTDTLVGIAYPLAGRNFSPEEEQRIRLAVGNFCLEQVRLGRPYNFNLLNPHVSDAFYCSQLAYNAYLPFNIDLNTGLGIPQLPGTESIVFPQEIWSGCVHRKADEEPGTDDENNKAGH